jgi:predicted PurR-regulated permease PerM
MIKATDIFWSIALVVFIFLVILFQAVLLPFVVGFGLAYFLDPVNSKLEKWGLNRTISTILTLVGFFVCILLLVFLIFPLLRAQLIDFIAWLPHGLEQLKQLLSPFMADIENLFDIKSDSPLKEFASEYIGDAFKWVMTFMGSLISSGAALANILALIFITPVVSFYLMRDWPLIIKTTDSYFPRRNRDTIHKIFREIDTTLAGFVRGQVSVCFILAGYYAIGLSLAGLEFGLIIGVLSGLLSFIPYVGSIFGLILSLGLAFIQFQSDWMSISIVAIVFFVGQLIEGNFLGPVLVGSRVGLHPVWVIFALLAATSLMGFVGALLAIPLAAVIGVLVRFVFDQYKQSMFFVGKKSRAK